MILENMKTKMKIKLIILLLSFWHGCMLPCYSQSAYWIVQPNTYNEISYIAHNTYKVVKNGKIGLINAHGEIIAEATNDELTGFYDNKALLLMSDGNGNRIIGCVTSNGIFYRFSNAYYTLNGQAFYSDGLLSVCDAKRQLGYINEKGNPIVGFSGKYDKIKPFVEGYAAVFHRKKYSLIDKDGQTVRFALDGVGEIFGGTNVYNNMVYVWDTNGKFYTYDVEKGGLCKKAKAPKNTSSVDYLYRFSCITGLGKQPVFNTPKEPSESDPGFPSAISGTKGKGYTLNNKNIIKEQLTHAGAFLSGVAIIIKDGRCGMIGFAADDDFSVKSTNKVIRFKENKSVTCKITIHIPKVWKVDDLHIKITDDDGNPLKSNMVDNTLHLEVNPTNNETKNYHVMISSFGLSLWEGTIQQKYEMIQLCKTCKSDIKECPYKGNHEKKSNETNTQVKDSYEYKNKNKFEY